MAKAASTQTVTLQDGSVLELRPLNIKLFRSFQDRWTEMIEENPDSVLEQVDALIDLAVICVSRELGERKDDREWLEDVLDFDTIYLILKACADVDLKPTNATLTALAGAQWSKFKLELEGYEAEAMWSGAWKSFDELEDNLTVDELLLLLKHGRKRDDRLYKVIMASAGAEVDWSEENDEVQDIADLKGAQAAQEGFGIGFGLEYSVEE